jgi:hypothetical protein
VFGASGFGGVEEGAGALVLAEEEAVREEDFAFVGGEEVVAFASGLVLVVFLQDSGLRLSLVLGGRSRIAEGRD